MSVSLLLMLLCSCSVTYFDSASLSWFRSIYTYASTAFLRSFVSSWRFFCSSMLPSSSMKSCRV